MSVLREIARRLLGEEKARRVWKRIDVVGDIAIMKMPIHGEISIEEMQLLAEEVLRALPSVNSVWLAGGPVEGRFKTRKSLIHLAGERRTETVYREHGCEFKVDIARVFITPRLSFEHLRIARLVEPGEVVVNMFAGVGIFSILIARKSRAALVYSIDVNPEAYRLMVENVRINRVEDRVIPILGDAASVVSSRLQGVGTRVLMPLPDLSLDYIPYALRALRGEGWIHVYLHLSHEKRKSHLEKAEKLVDEMVRKEGWRIVESKSREVRSVGPRLVQVVVDALVSR
ncbi:MAG: class I SAM-dependent methyltransferase family protein [Aeropyrum sp.]|nr:class I SAM-dependent methyltransferase family protein [Aeropyrum sp.]